MDERELGILIGRFDAFERKQTEMHSDVMDERELGILIGRFDAFERKQTEMHSDVKEMKGSISKRVGKVEKDLGEVQTGIKIIKWVAATPAALVAIGGAIMAVLRHG